MKPPVLSSGELFIRIITSVLSRGIAAFVRRDGEGALRLFSNGRGKSGVVLLAFSLAVHSVLTVNSHIVSFFYAAKVHNKWIFPATAVSS